MDNENNNNNNNIEDGLEYLNGFGNELESSCIMEPSAVPVGRNNPREVPYGLYTEQLSGTAFTKPRAAGNRRTWLYRIQPSVAHHHIPAVVQKTTNNNNRRVVVYFGHCSPKDCQPQVDAIRWHPKPFTAATATQTTNLDCGGFAISTVERTTFIEGCHLQCHGGGCPSQKNGVAMYVYEFTHDMIPTHPEQEQQQEQQQRTKQCMYNADGEFLIVPQQGTLEIITELGKLHVLPKEIVVIPRGIVFSVNKATTATKDNDTSSSSSCKGYVLEVYGGDGFQLPELGPIGSNGLANARDFYYPVASCNFDSHQDYQQPYTLTIKMQSQLFTKRTAHSPYNVVAWHGNYLPYKYNLTRFCVVNSVSYDHLDPSIYTVLTVPSAGIPGTALVDFVIFPPRYMATDSQTFRPPWFHRNTMSEYMGLICGQYDAKSSAGFQPGGASLHNCMTPHGPDQESYQKAVADPCDTPIYFDKGLAFMFETYLPLTVTPASLEYHDTTYSQTSWAGLSAHYFTGWPALANAKNKEKGNK